jgi:hypothetical protein
MLWFEHGLRMVETVGICQVLWLVMLESAKVDTPGQ